MEIISLGNDMGLFLEKVKRIVVDHTFTLIGEEVGGRRIFQGTGVLLSSGYPIFSYLVVIRMAG